MKRAEENMSVAAVSRLSTLMRMSKEGRYIDFPDQKYLEKMYKQFPEQYSKLHKKITKEVREDLMRGLG